MKKIFAAFILIFLMSSLSYGATSEDIYVRKDVFDAKIEALFDRLHGEIVEMKSELKSDIQALSGRIDALSGRVDALSGRIDGLDGRIDGLDYKIDVLQTVVYWGLGFLTFLVGSLVLAPIFSGIVQSLRKPSFTLEDVREEMKKLIAEAQLSGKPQA